MGDANEFTAEEHTGDDGNRVSVELKGGSAALAASDRDLVSSSSSASSPPDAQTALADEPPLDPATPDDAPPPGLWRRVTDAGGMLRVVPSVEPGNWNQAIRAAMASPERPPGKGLQRRRAGPPGSRDFDLIIVDYLLDYTELRPVLVAVPKKVSQYHPLAQAYFDNRDWHFVSANLVRRAALVLHLLATEAERRGYRVSSVSHARQRSESGQLLGANSHLALSIDGRTWGMKIVEISGSGGEKRSIHTVHNPPGTAAWRAERPWEFIPTGRLALRISGGSPHHASEKFSDAKSHSVEDKLPLVFQALDLQALEARRLVEIQAARQIAWQLELDQERDRARAAWREESLHGALAKQIESSKFAKEARAYLDEMQSAIESLSEEARPPAREWHDWATAHVSVMEPLSKPPRMPTLPEPTNEQLRPFLRR